MLGVYSKRSLIVVVSIGLLCITFLFRPTFFERCSVRAKAAIIEVENHYPTHPTGQCKIIYGGKDSNHHVIRNPKECFSINNEVRRKKEKIRVVSVHCGNPDLIFPQKKSLDAFMMEAYDYIIYDDSIATPDVSNYFSTNMTEKMKEAISLVGAEYRRIPPQIHVDRRCLFPHTIEPFTQNSNVRVSNNFQFMFRDSVNFCSESKIIFMDADVLLTKPLNVTDFLRKSNVSAAGVAQYRGYKSTGFSFSITYIWNSILIFDLTRLPDPLDLNFDCGRVYVRNAESSVDVVDYLDTNGHLYEWLHKHNPRVKFMNLGSLWTNTEAPFVKTVSLWNQKLSNSSLNVKRVQILDDYFLHFRNGGNWMSEGPEVKFQIKIMVDILIDHIERVRNFYSRTPGITPGI